MDFDSLEAALQDLEIQFRDRTPEANRDAIRPLLDAVLAEYVDASEDERAAIRDIMGGPICASAGLLEYILECAECLESPDDADAFYLGLVAASIENYSQDFRDTSACLAELAMAAVKAGIDIELYCVAVAELSSAEKSRSGVIPMQRTLSQFHIYAPTAIRLF